MVIVVIIYGWCSQKGLGLAFGLVGHLPPHRSLQVHSNPSWQNLLRSAVVIMRGSWISPRPGICQFGLHFPAPLFLAGWLCTQLCPVSESQFPNSQWGEYEWLSHKMMWASKWWAIHGIGCTAGHGCGPWDLGTHALCSVPWASLLHLLDCKPLEGLEPDPLGPLSSQ